MGQFPTTSQQTQQTQTQPPQTYNQQNQSLALHNLPQDWSYFVMYRNWTNLRILRLCDCKIGDSGAKLLGNLLWPNLKVLKIKNNQISAFGLKMLLTHELPKLWDFWLCYNNIGNEGIQILSSTQNIPKLKQLSVGQNQISWLGLNRLLVDSRLNRLSFLILAGNYNIGCTGLKLIIKAEFPQLQILNISNCYLGNEGAKYLSKGIWPRLQNIFIEDNKLKMDGYFFSALIDCRDLKLIAVCEEQQEIDSAAAMSLVCANWSYKATVWCYSQLGDVDEVMETRFIRLNEE